MSKTDEVYEILRQRILSGEFSSGFRLIIDALARQLGVSAIPVREAIRRLEAEGLVRHEPNVGAAVAGMDEDEYREILTVLARLEGWATALSVPHATPDDLIQLTELVSQMHAAVDGSQLETYTRLNRQFHRVLRQRCPNRFLGEMVERCWTRVDQVRRNIFVRVPDRARTSLQDHYQMLQSIREHAPPRVLQELVEDHQITTMDAYLSRLDARHGGDGPGSSPIAKGGRP